MHPAQFFLFLGLTIITIFGVIWPFPGALVGILVIFVGIPLLDRFVGESKINPTFQQEQTWKQSKFWVPALYIYSLTHFGLLVFAAQRVMSFNFGEILLCGVVMGIYTGGLGITVAHELCHKKEAHHRMMADLLLASVWYYHFSVEHIRGHHFQVATLEDPASARRNENIYEFILRSVTGTFIHAWQLDARKVIVGVIVSTMMTVVAFLLGVQALVFFLIQAVVAFTLLEMVNYIEHYGLSRMPLGNGRYEKVLPIHSWNSSHKISNLVLFNLQRHSDHHAWAHFPYTILRHHPEAPQLPSGYPGMILLALIPPLWFKKMNPMLDEMGHYS